MNERIKELWKQSQTRQEVETFTEGIFHTRVTDNYEKFAELIVGECVSQMEWQKLSPKAEGAYNSAISLAQRNIKEHFGIDNYKATIIAGAELHSDKDYRESTAEEVEEFARKRNERTD